MIRQWLQKHRRLLKWSVSIAAALWLLNFLFFGISIDDFFIKGRLADAKANWEASGIRNYRMVIDVGIPLSMWPTGRIAITVRNGVIVKAEQKDLFDLSDQNYDPDKASFEPIDPEKVSHFTMDGLFDLASGYLGHQTGRIILDFSPSSSNYIEFFREDCYSPPPLLVPAISECGFTYKIQEFEPLAD
jgi:hypothetical protein